jgi:serine protease Do
MKSVWVGGWLGIASMLTSFACPSSLSAQSEDFSAQYKKVRPRIVTILNSDGLGSGFFVRADTIVTNAHVVGKDKSVKVVRADKQQTQGNVVWRNADEDIAFVQIFVDYLDVMADKGYTDDVLHGRNPGALQFTTKPVEAGMPVYAIGTPNVNPEDAPQPFVVPGNLTSGHVSQVLDDGTIVLDMTIQHGNSGGPALNSQGEIIGMVTARAEDSKTKVGLGVAYAIPWKKIKTRLEEFEQAQNLRLRK